MVRAYNRTFFLKRSGYGVGLLEITVDIHTSYYLDSRCEDGSFYDTIINYHVPAVSGFLSDR